MNVGLLLSYITITIIITIEVAAAAAAYITDQSDVKLAVTIEPYTPS